MSCTGSCNFHHSISSSCYCYGNDHYYNYYYENRQRAKMLKWRWLELVLGEKYERGEKMAIENWHLYYGKWIWGKKIRISFTFWDSSNCFLEGAKARINHLECPVLTVITCTIQIVVAMSGDKRREHFGVLWNVCQKVVMFLNIVFFWPFLFYFLFLCSTFIYFFIGA